MLALMTAAKRIVLAILLITIIYLISYRYASQPLLGVAIEYDGQELFAPRNRLSCDKPIAFCALRLNGGISIDLTKNLTDLPGNCSAARLISLKSTQDLTHFGCFEHLHGYWGNVVTQRRVVVLTGIELTTLQTVRMQVETWIVAIVTGSGSPFKLFLASLSTLLGFQVTQSLYRLQCGWGTRKIVALLNAATAGSFVALFGWIPLFIIAEIWRIG